MHTVGKRNKFTFILLSNFKLGKGSSPQIHPVAKVNTGTQNHNKSYVQLTKIRLSSYTRIECNNAPNIKPRSHCARQRASTPGRTDATRVDAR